jgi:hypothetical protein
MNAPAAPSFADLTQGQLDAYNAQDLDAYCSFFAEDLIVADLNGAVTIQGLAAFRDKYAKVFAEFPQNRAALVHRMVLAGAVIDHERVSRTFGGDTFDVAAIYTFAGGKIARIDFVK